MKFKVYVFSLWMATLILSCHDGKKETTAKNSALNPNDTVQQKSIETAAIDTVSILNNLQGKWKEPAYPFRLAHFKDSTVKFVEEGVVEKPTFKAFRISTQCPFEVNNLKNAGTGDLFLVMLEARACEIVKVSNDTLTLSGFNVNTGSDYNIIYTRVE